MGTAFADAFVKTCSVICYDKFIPPKKISGVVYVQGELCDFEAIALLCKEYGVKVMIHLVSSLLPASSFEDYCADVDRVQKPTQRLLRFCGENGITFVFSSSGGTVYGSQHGLLSETHQSEPISYYGLSKQETENLILFYHRTFNLNYLILRISNPYGPGQNLYGKQGLIAVILGKLFTGERVTVFGDGNSVRDYLYIEDLKRYVRALIEKGVVNRTINVGSGTGYAVNAIIDAIESVTQKKLTVEYVPSRTADVKEVVLCVDALRSIVPYEARSLTDGIRSFYEYLTKEENR